MNEFDSHEPLHDEGSLDEITSQVFGLIDDLVDNHLTDDLVADLDAVIRARTGADPVTSPSPAWPDGLSDTQAKQAMSNLERSEAFDAALFSPAEMPSVSIETHSGIGWIRANASQVAERYQDAALQRAAGIVAQARAEAQQIRADADRLREEAMKCLREAQRAKAEAQLLLEQAVALRAAQRQATLPMLGRKVATGPAGRPLVTGQALSYTAERSSGLEAPADDVHPATTRTPTRSSFPNRVSNGRYLDGTGPAPASRARASSTPPASHACPRCGARVADSDQEDHWHEQADSASRPASTQDASV